MHSKHRLFLKLGELYVNHTEILVLYNKLISHNFNFIHLLKRQHNYMQKNESEHLTNQQHETLKKLYLAQSTQ